MARSAGHTTARSVKQTQTLSTHLEELRRRLAIAFVCFIAAGGAAYAIHVRIIEILRAPLDDTLYFSSPGGGFNFVLKVCILAGALAVSPVVIYQIIRFVEPILPHYKRRALLRYMVGSFLLLAAGVSFGYFVTLPAALHFLANFGGENVQALIAANEYMNFVLAYLVGFGLLFQLPIILLFINRIRPLQPRRMVGALRFVILGSFILAAILTPTPDPLNQTLMAGPLIAMYVVSVVLVMVIGRSARQNARLLEQQIADIAMPSDIVEELTNPSIASASVERS